MHTTFGNVNKWLQYFVHAKDHTVLIHSLVNTWMLYLGSIPRQWLFLGIAVGLFRCLSAVQYRLQNSAPWIVIMIRRGCNQSHFPSMKTENIPNHCKVCMEVKGYTRRSLETCQNIGNSRLVTVEAPLQTSMRCHNRDIWTIDLERILLHPNSHLCLDLVGVHRRASKRHSSQVYLFQSSGGSCCRPMPLPPQQQWLLVRISALAHPNVFDSSGLILAGIAIQNFQRLAGQRRQHTREDNEKAWQNRDRDPK